MPNYFSRLSYSFGNEDCKSEQQALRINPDDRVLCVTASGDRPLNLLLSDCREIDCIDANKVQNYLLSLKKSALKNLPYDKYISFLGGSQDLHRIETLHKLVDDMDHEARHFWLQNKKPVSDGILYQGALESLIRKVSYFFRLTRRTKLKRLFEMDDIEEQKVFVKNEWDNYLWGKMFHIALNPKISRLFLEDPGLYAYPDRSVSIGKNLYRKMNNSLMRYLAKENFFISLFLRGFVGEEAYPPYLSRTGTEIIKKRLDRISSIETSDLIHYMEAAPESSYDVFSLSDVASYVSEEKFHKMVRAMVRAAKPGARFCIRQFLSNHKIPHDVTPYLHRDPLLENKLQEEDVCFTYSFMVGNIAK